ncbi:MAG: tetratricopeptide repeat protein [Pseudomonadota bacterium]
MPINRRTICYVLLMSAWLSSCTTTGAVKPCGEDQAQDLCSSTMEQISRRIERHPDDAAAYLSRGLKYLNESGDMEAAIADFTKVLDLKPDCATAYSLRAEAYIEASDYDHALADGTKAIELNPDYGASYYSRADAYRGRGAFDLAIRDYTRAMELGMAKEWVLVDRGLAYQKLGLMSAAEADYQAALGGSRAQKARELLGALKGAPNSRQ